MRQFASRLRAVNIYLMTPLLGALVFVAVFVAALAPPAQAATSSNLNFQARLLTNTGAVVPDGSYNIEFKIYNADGTTGSQGSCSGACLWMETRTGGNVVSVINGYFSVNLGSVTSFPAINWDQQLWLTMRIGGTGSPSWDGEMQNSGHSIALTALPYSFVAGQLALTSGAHRGTLSFNTVATDPSILLPDASGTICLQTSSACGFETTSGTDFIRNQTSSQTANFNIQSAASGSIGAVITGAASQSVDIFDIKANGVSTPLFSVSNNGSILIQTTSSDSATAVQIQDHTGTSNLLVADTTTNRIGIGKAPTAGYQLDVAGSIGSQTRFVINSSATSGGTLTKKATIGAGGVNANDVVVMNSSSQAVQTTTARDTRIYGVSLTTTGSGSPAEIAIAGNITVNANTGAVSIGDQLVTSTTAGRVTTDNNATTGILGVALTSKAGGSNGTVDVALGQVRGQYSPVFRNASDSATAFQVQNASASSYLNINTTDGYVIDNGADAVGNVIQNPGFESSGTTDATGWFTPSASQVLTNSSADAHGGNYELQVSGNSSTHAVTTKYYAVHPGDTVYAEGWVKNSGGANGDAGLYLEFSDKDKGNATFSNADTGLPGTSYVLKSFTVAVPSGKFFVRIAASVKATSTTGTFYFDDFYLKKVNEQAPLLITNTSSTAFQVQNASSQTILGVDASTSKIFTTIPDGGSAIGFTLNTPSYTTSGAKLLSLQNNGTPKLTVDKDGNVTITGGLALAGAVSGATTVTGSGNFNSTGGSIQTNSVTRIDNSGNLSGIGNFTAAAGSTFATTGATGFTFKPGTDNTTAFQVQNAASSKAVLTVDTTGNKTILGTSGASGITGTAQFNYSGSSGSITIAPLDPSSTAYTLSLPAETGTFCTSAASSTANCTNFASASSVTTSLAGKLNKGSVDTSSAAVTAVQGNLYAFTNSSSGIASGVLKLDNGNNTDNALYITGTTDYASGKAYIVVNNTNGTPTGNLIDLQSNAADKFTVDASGNVAAAGNISIASGKVYQINGTQITSAALSDGSNLAKLNGTQTFTADNTFSSASNSFTGNGSGLTSLNATNVSSGTLNDGRLSSNVALLNRTGQSFTGDNTFAPTSNGAGTVVKQTSGTATSGSVLDVQTQNGSSHFLQITNAAANEGNVTLQSVGATRDLTLGSGSGTIIVAAATGTIQHSNTSLTIDVNSGSNSTLFITNAGAGIGSLDVEGSINVGGSQVYKVNGTSGTSTTCSSNTFSQNQVVNGGITTSVSCANAVTAIGAAGGSIANGASISGNTLTLGYADTTNPGLVSTASQTFAGAKTIQVNNAAAFQVQNTSSRSLFNVDTSGNAVAVGNSTDGAQIVLGATGNATGVVEKTMVVNGTIAANDLTEIDTANAGQVKQAAASSTKIFGVATSAVGSGSSQNIVISGMYQVNANASGGTIAVGDTLVSSSTAGQATKAGSTTSSGSVIGLAMSTLSGGKVWVYINLGLGGSDNLQTVYSKDLGGTTPDIKVSSGVGGLDIQDADSTIGASLFNVRASNGSGLGTALFSVGNTGNTSLQTTTNSSTAFQVQNSIGSNVLVAGTSALNSLIYNGSIENADNGNWASKTGTTTQTRVTTQSYIGAASEQAVFNSTSTNDGVKYVFTNGSGSPGALTASTTYMLTFYLRENSGDTSAIGTNLQVGFNSGSDTACTLSPTLGTQSVPTGGWARYSCTIATDGSPTTSDFIYWQETDNPGSTRTLYIDGIQLEQTSSVISPFQESTLQLNGVVTSPIAIRNASDSTTALQVFNSAGTSVFNVDTVNSRVGVGTAAPKEALQVNGAINLGTTSSTNAGTIRWSGTDFEGYDGSQWKSMTTQFLSVNPQINVRKSADECVNSGGAGGCSATGSTLQDDNDLVFSIGVNETWNFRFVLFINSANAPDSKYTVTATGASSCTFGFGDFEGQSGQGNLSCGTASQSVAGTGSYEINEVMGTVVAGASAVTVHVQWAQNAPATSATTVSAGSFLQANRILSAGDSTLQAFVDNGNSFGAAADLGTNDAFDLNLRTNGNTIASFSQANGSVLFKNSTNSTTAFQVQNTSSDSLLTIDTTGTGVVKLTPLPSSFGDEFNISTVDPKWTFSKGASGAGNTSDVNTTQTGKLHFTADGTANHDCSGTTVNCLRLLETGPSGDFTATTKLDSMPAPLGSGNYNQLGIMVYQDTSLDSGFNNYMTFVLESDGGTGNTFRIVTEKTIHNATSTTSGCSGLSSSTVPPVYLRVIRSGTTWTVSYSLNGTSFTQCDNFTQSLTINSGTGGIGLVHDVFAITGNPTNWAFTGSNIDWFHLDTGTSSPVLNVNGAALYQAQADSSAAFQIQSAGGTNVMNIDTTNNKVIIGASDTTGTLLVLDTDSDATYSAGSAASAAAVVDGAMFYSSTNRSFLCGVAGAWETCSGLLYSNTASSSAINTCTTACAAFSRAAPIPANYCQAGRVIHIIARGIYGVQNVAAQTFALGVYYGTDSSTKTNDTLLGTSTTTTSVTNLTNNGWKLDTTIICYDTTHMQAEGDFTYSLSNTAATAAQTILQADTATTGTTVTSTSAKNIYLFPAFGASNSANTATLQQIIVTGD
jgi:hypothetical protein